MDVPKEQLYIYTGEQVNPKDLKAQSRVLIITNRQDLLNGSPAFIGYLGSTIKRSNGGITLEIPNRVIVKQTAQTGNYELYMGKTVSKELFVEDQEVSRIIDTPKRVNLGVKIEAKPKIELKKAGL